MIADATLAVLLALSCSVTWGIANVYVQRAARSLGDLRAMLWAQLIGSAVLTPIGVAIGGAPATSTSPCWRAPRWRRPSATTA